MLYAKLALYSYYMRTIGKMPPFCLVIPIISELYGLVTGATRPVHMTLPSPHG